MKECKRIGCNKKFLINRKHIQFYCSRECMYKTWVENHRSRIKEIHDKWLKNNPKRRKEQMVKYERKIGKIPREEWYKFKIPRGKNHPWWRGGTTKRVDKSGWRILRHEVWERDCFLCQTCGVRLARGIRPTTHHILPVRMGGKDTLENLVTLCPSCHMKVEWSTWEFGNITL